MAEWIDTTSYGRDERGKVAPRAWTLRAGQKRDMDRGAIHVEIHGLHGMPGAWFVSADDLWIGRHDLKTTDVEEAKSRAIKVVRERLRSLTAALSLATSGKTHDGA